jgi:hypothetical protein
MSKKVREPKQVFQPDTSLPVDVVKVICFEHLKGRGRSIRCPLCGKLMKNYKRSINRKMVVALVLLYKRNALEKGRWVPVQDIYAPGQGGDYAKLRYWGLVEAGDKRTAHKNSIGYWRITDLGKLFCEEKIKVFKYAVVYANECIGMAGDQVDIVQCNGENFSYPALMSR